MSDAHPESRPLEPNAPVGESPAFALAEGSALLTADILGHPSDFLITQKRECDQIKITVETVMPSMRWDAKRQCLLTWAPPRYPWPNT